MDEAIALFSYGTLQNPNVQLATYGRLVEGQTDCLAGYVLIDLVIDDPHVVSLSGKKVHTIARRTGRAEDRIFGTMLFLTSAELVNSDDYEVEAYARTEVILESGRIAFAYVEASSRG
jgi:hypothetical protein